MTKKLSIWYKGVKFTEGQKIKMKIACGKCHRGEVYPLVAQPSTGGLYAYNKANDGWCDCFDKWRHLPKKTQARTSNGRFAGKEAKNPDMGNPASGIEADNKASEWKDTVEKSVHPDGIEITSNNIYIRWTNDDGSNEFTPEEARAFQKKLQLAIERWEQLFNQKK